MVRRENLRPLVVLVGHETPTLSVYFPIINGIMVQSNCIA